MDPGNASRDGNGIDITVGDSSQIFSDAAGWRVDQINIIVQTMHRQGLSAVLQPLPNASHTRDRVLSPPNSRCFQGTRTKVLKKIRSWFDSSLLFGNPHIMWIYGYAGCGKSAIAQVIAEQVSNQGRLAGSFFFFRGSGNRDCIARFASTIASQLAATIPATEPIIRAAIEAAPGLLSTSATTLSAQFQHLVYDAFAKSTGKRNLILSSLGLKSFLIVLDGLDECEDKEQITTFIEDMIEFFNSNARTPLRFLITSRVEDHLYQCLHSSDQVELLNLVEHTSDVDISTALDIAIAREKRGLEYTWEASWPYEEDKRKLVEHIGGSYIFMTTLIKLLFDQSSEDGQTPMQRLPQLLAVKPDFDSLYKRTLEESRGLPHFRNVIRMVSLAQEPLSIIQIAELLDIEPFHVSKVLLSLHSVMQVPGDDRSPVTLWHTSLRDFLCSKDRAGPSVYTDSVYHLYLAFRSTALSHESPGTPNTSLWQAYASRYADSHLMKSARGADTTTWGSEWCFHAISGDLKKAWFRGNNTALEIACREEECGLLGALVNAGIKADTKISFRHIRGRMLHLCAVRGDDEITRFLLKHGANPNTKNSVGETPLHSASYHGNVKVMRHLLEFGADPNIQNDSRRTPIHWTCYWGHVDAARLLLDHNANPSIRAVEWGTPLQCASKFGHQTIVSVFYERGVSE